MSKSIEELREIREKTKNNMEMRRKDDSAMRVVVGMATCGIAAGARPVLNAFLEEVGKRNLGNITIGQTGCIGICQHEPIVEVFEPGKEKVTYIKMDAEKAARVVLEHLVNRKIVDDYTVGSIGTL